MGAVCGLSTRVSAGRRRHDSVCVCVCVCLICDLLMSPTRLSVAAAHSIMLLLLCDPSGLLQVYSRRLPEHRGRARNGRAVP